jgi:hypothetical protein
MCVPCTIGPSRSSHHQVATTHGYATFKVVASTVYSSQVRPMNVASFENRVIELCYRAINTEDDEEVRRLASELRQILHERIEHLRERLVSTSIASAFSSDRSEGH